MQQIHIQIANLPISIVCLSNGQIGFVKTSDTLPIFDQPEKGISAKILPDKLVVGNSEFLYNITIDYKNKPELLQWLQEQNIENPLKG